MLDFFKNDKFLSGFDNHFLNEINATLPYYGPLLYLWARLHNSKNILEVGIERGYTSYYLAQAAKLNNGIYYGIDKDIEWCEKIERILKQENLPHKIINKDTKEIRSLKEFGIERIDIAFLDGEHSTEAVSHEIELIYPLLSSDGWGFIFIHDIIDTGNAGIWLKLKGDKRFESLGLNPNYGLGILRKIEGVNYEVVAKKYEIKSLYMPRYEFLADMINRNGYKRIVEVGVDKGETTKYLLEHCDLKYYVLVDNNFNSELEAELRARKLVKKCPACPRPVEILKMDSVEAAKKFRDKEFDLVFIDASHDYQSVLNDILAWKPKVREGGIICGHDFFRSGDKPYSQVHSAVKKVFSWVNLVSDESPNSDRCVWWRYI